MFKIVLQVNLLANTKSKLPVMREKLNKYAQISN